MINSLLFAQEFESRGSEYFWCSQGPDNFSGKMRAICVDRTNEQHVYAGASGGGLYESFDGGQHWQTVENWVEFMYISSIVQSADGTIFVGTGHSFFESLTVGGVGVYYLNPNDVGAQWTLVPGTQNLIVFCLAANNVDNKIYFGTSSGLYSWDKNQGGNPQNMGLSVQSCNTVRVSNDGQVVFCRFGSTTGSLFGSNDGGQNFVSLFDQSQIEFGAMRVDFSISPTRVNGSYVCYAIGVYSNGTKFYRSTDSGINWSSVSPMMPHSSGIYLLRNAMAIHPVDFNQIFFGQTDMFRASYNQNSESLDFEQISLWFAPPTSALYVPENQNQIVFSQGNKMFIATDGGIALSDDFGSSFSSFNYNLTTTEIYGIASSGNGRMIAGAWSAGCLYNNLENATPKSYEQIFGGYHFDVAMSFFNSNISFSGLYYGGIKRVVDSPNGAPILSSFVPDYVGYQMPGDLNSGNHFHFRTKLDLEESIQEFTLDSVYYLPTSNLNAGSQIQVSSLATGNTISHTLLENTYFDEVVNYDPSLTIQDFEITDLNSGLTYQLYPLTWSYLQGSGDPEVGDIILISAPFELILTVGEVTTYDRYFAQHPITMKLLDMGTMQQMNNVSWDTVAVADPFQSIFITHTRQNGGELYATRDALRLGQTPKWARIAEGIGNMFEGELAISSDLEHIYVGTATGLWRIDGFKNVFSTQDDFHELCDLRVGSAPLISKTLIFEGQVSGISINPSNLGDVMITVIGSGPKVWRSSIANSVTGLGSFQNIQGNLPNGNALNDCLIDVDNSDRLLVATDLGVWSSNDAGVSWVSSSNGMGPVQVNRIIQNWRIDHPNTTKPGEIYLATNGRGVYSTGACTDFVGLPNEFSEAVEEMNLLLYPNPVEGNAHLLIEVETGSMISFDVISISGQQVFSSQYALNPGRNDVFLPLDSLEKGLYIVRVRLNETTWSTKFIKI